MRARRGGRVRVQFLESEFLGGQRSGVALASYAGQARRRFSYAAAGDSGRRQTGHSNGEKGDAFKLLSLKTKETTDKSSIPFQHYQFYNTDYIIIVTIKITSRFLY
jgi:hypothetical protein